MINHNKRFLDTKEKKFIRRTIPSSNLNISQLKMIAAQAKKTTIIHQGRIIVPLILIILSCFLLPFSIFLFSRTWFYFFENQDINYYALSVALIFELVLFLLSIRLLTKSIPNVIGKEKKFITLTPDGFITPHDDHLYPWAHVVDATITIVYFTIVEIRFRMIKDPKTFDRTKLKTGFGEMFDKSVFPVSIVGLGFRKMTPKKARKIIASYMDAAAARAELDARGVADKIEKPNS